MKTVYKGIGLILTWMAFTLLLSPDTLAFIPDTTTSTTYYVAINGADTAACGSRVDPCNTIQQAVNQSSSGDIIKVAAGSYTYQRPLDRCSFLSDSPAVVCVWDLYVTDLTILGGYTTDNWETANPSVNTTTIDGQDTYRGVHLESTGQGAHLRIEGITITNGLADHKESTGLDSRGGGMQVQNGTVTLRNMVFQNNRAQGASGNLNGRAGAGGGLSIINSGGTSILEFVRFENNSALGGPGISGQGGVGIGGGLFTFSATIKGSHITFINNKAIGGQGADQGTETGGLGGAIAFQLGTIAAIDHILAIGNRAEGGEGNRNGSGGFGGAIQVEEGNLKLVDGLFQENVAVGGRGFNGGVARAGGIEAFNADVTIERVRFIANSVLSGPTTGGGVTNSTAGGGLYISKTRGNYTGTIVNSLFADNEVAFGSPDAANYGGGGGGVVVAGMKVKIIHTTFARNKLGKNVIAGQALIVQLYPGGETGSADISYSIFADHIGKTPFESTVHVSKGSIINLASGLFANNVKDTNSDGVPVDVGTFTGLETMIKADSAGFVSPGAPSYDYHLMADSAAVDQAIGSTTTEDITQLTRPIGTAADLGAYEYINLSNHLYIPMLSK